MEESSDVPSIDVDVDVETRRLDPVEFERRVEAMVDACDQFDWWEERLKMEELPSVATLVRRATDADAGRRRRARAVASLGLVPDPEAALALDWLTSGGDPPSQLGRLAEVARIEWEMRWASETSENCAREDAA